MQINGAATTKAKHNSNNKNQTQQQQQKQSQVETSCLLCVMNALHQCLRELHELQQPACVSQPIRPNAAEHSNKNKSKKQNQRNKNKNNNKATHLFTYLDIYTFCSICQFVCSLSIHTHNTFNANAVFIVFQHMFFEIMFTQTQTHTNINCNLHSV